VSIVIVDPDSGQAQDGIIRIKDMTSRKRKTSPSSDAFEDDANSFSSYEHVSSTSTRKKAARKVVRRIRRQSVRKTKGPLCPPQRMLPSTLSPGTPYPTLVHSKLHCSNGMEGFTSYGACRGGNRTIHRRARNGVRNERMRWVDACYHKPGTHTQQ